MADLVSSAPPPPRAGISKLPVSGPTRCESAEKEDERLPAETAYRVVNLGTLQPLPVRHAAPKPNPTRWTMTFAVIAVLVGAVGFIVFWGLAHSDWLYGTYGQITQEQWDRIAHLRDGLVDIGVAPDAVAALDDALLLPPPSMEQVLFDLRVAADALERFADSATIHEIRDQLMAMIAEIAAESGLSPALWGTPATQPTPTAAWPADLRVARADAVGLNLTAPNPK